MKVVVTGGAGFIGANLVHAFHTRPEIDSVVVVDNLSTGSRANLACGGADVLEGSVLDRSLMDAACAGAGAVVHLAALPSVPRSIEDPVSTHHANITGTLEVLEAARRAVGSAGPPHVVVASSSSVYGANTALPKQETMRTVPLSPYGVSKQATESYAIAYAHCFGLPVLPFRFFNVFGPLQSADHAYAAAVPAFVSAAVAGRPLTVYGDGKQTRDFTFVGSVCSVIVDALLRRVTSRESVNLAFGTRTSLLQLIDLLGSVLGCPVRVEHHAHRPGDVRDSQADTTRLRALFPDVLPVPLRDGLEATVAWFRSLAAPAV